MKTGIIYSVSVCQWGGGDSGGRERDLKWRRIRPVEGVKASPSYNHPRDCNISSFKGFWRFLLHTFWRIRKQNYIVYVFTLFSANILYRLQRFLLYSLFHIHYILYYILFYWINLKLISILFQSDLLNRTIFDKYTL